LIITAYIKNLIHEFFLELVHLFTHILGVEGYVLGTSNTEGREISAGVRENFIGQLNKSF
jgi:hypothetical protein